LRQAILWATARYPIVIVMFIILLLLLLLLLLIVIVIIIVIIIITIHSRHLQDPGVWLHAGGEGPLEEVLRILCGSLTQARLGTAVVGRYQAVRQVQGVQPRPHLPRAGT
jgi:hypothetical protein